MPTLVGATVYVGIGKADITPSMGTPSAGYADRRGEGMEGMHDPLKATALLIDNGEKKVVLCSVDHLGFTHAMVKQVIARVQEEGALEECDIYIGSSHTHSGGGAYLDLPLLGERLAGAYDSRIAKFYVEKTAEAIVQATQALIPAKVGIGYGKAEAISQYRGGFPPNIAPLDDVAVIKVTRIDGTPLAVIFNYPLHPTILREENRLFSADFVGYAREHLQEVLGSELEPLYFNGAQGDIIPVVLNEKDRFDACAQLGHSLAQTVEQIWAATETSDHLSVQIAQEAYSFIPQATPFGLVLPVKSHETEMNLIVLNERHAFLTIPGELSCIYDYRLKEFGKSLGYAHVSIFGLTQDAHGYMISPASWQKKTAESATSFGGEDYGESTQLRAEQLLIANRSW
ncbi:MAG: neutral/alkaline non-lysosomal ceramidase N-terminal domain-containing protein [Verrucomicrobia bacterium]|nr:neutral/alkaline non-lysosomal ceramidase N-terminal domain-containing protein [Verrucomicrobiota bacterium]